MGIFSSKLKILKDAYQKNYEDVESELKILKDAYQKNREDVEQIYKGKLHLLEQKIDNALNSLFLEYKKGDVVNGWHIASVKEAGGQDFWLARKRINGKLVRIRLGNSLLRRIVEIKIERFCNKHGIKIQKKDTDNQE
jgi:hypothetical protein